MRWHVLKLNVIAPNCIQPIEWRADCEVVLNGRAEAQKYLN